MNMQKFLMTVILIVIGVSVFSFTLVEGAVIPQWIKNNAGWWAQGLISDDDFLNGIEYLINEDIIKLDPAIDGVPGVTITTLDNPNIYGTSLAIGDDWNPVISYTDYVGGNAELKFIHCTTRDCTISDPPVLVDSIPVPIGGVFQRMDSSIAISSDGSPMIAYYDDYNENLKFVTCSDPPSCTSFNPPIVVDPSGGFGIYPSLIRGNDGNPVIAYSNFASEGYGTSRLWFINCANPQCTGTHDVESPLITANEEGFFDISMTRSGPNPTISFVNHNGEVKVVRCVYHGCDEWFIPNIVDTQTNRFIGKGASIAIAPDGNPVLSYYDFATPSQSVLKYVHCTDFTCSSHDDPVILDESPTDSVGFHSDIEIGSHGGPVISYANTSGTALKFVYCETVACTNKFLVTIDSGEYTSLEIGRDRYPVISYVSGGALKIAHCENTVCAP